SPCVRIRLRNFLRKFCAPALPVDSCPKRTEAAHLSFALPIGSAIHDSSVKNLALAKCSLRLRVSALKSTPLKRKGAKTPGRTPSARDALPAEQRWTVRSPAIFRSGNLAGPGRRSRPSRSVDRQVAARG